MECGNYLELMEILMPAKQVSLIIASTVLAEASRT